MLELWAIWPNVNLIANATYFEKGFSNDIDDAVVNISFAKSLVSSKPQINICYC